MCYGCPFQSIKISSFYYTIVCNCLGDDSPGLCILSVAKSLVIGLQIADGIMQLNAVKKNEIKYMCIILYFISCMKCARLSVCVCMYYTFYTVYGKGSMTYTSYTVW